VILIDGVSYTFVVREGQNENEPSDIPLQDDGPEGSPSFTKRQTQGDCFADSAGPRPTQGRCGPSGAFGRSGRHQGKCPFGVEPRYAKRQTQRRDGHGREIFVRLERERAALTRQPYRDPLRGVPGTPLIICP